MNGGLGVYAHKGNTMELEQLLARGYKKRIEGKLRVILKKGIPTNKLTRNLLGKITRSKRKYKVRCPKSYKTYITSEWWFKRRNRFFKDFGKKCAVCGKSKYVQLHHAYYGEYGKEKDEDLVPLCIEHHEELHSMLGKTKKDMREETLDALEVMEYEINTRLPKENRDH